MAYLLSSERPATAAMSASSTTNPKSGLFAWFANMRKVRAQRRVLLSLLQLEPARLADMGLSRADIYDALRSPKRSLGETFSSRRAASARAWLQSGRL